jgi:hypothetical protein
LTRRAPDVVARRAAAAAAVPARRPAVQHGEQMEVPMPMPAPAPVVVDEVPAATLEQTPVPAPPAPAPAEPIAAEQPAASTGTDGATAPRSARSRRASVPAWDEIVFGARRAD